MVGLAALDPPYNITAPHGLAEVRISPGNQQLSGNVRGGQIVALGAIVGLVVQQRPFDERFLGVGKQERGQVPFAGRARPPRARAGGPVLCARFWIEADRGVVEPRQKQPPRNAVGPGNLLLAGDLALALPDEHPAFALPGPGKAIAGLAVGQNGLQTGQYGSPPGKSQPQLDIGVGRVAREKEPLACRAIAKTGLRC